MSAETLTDVAIADRLGFSSGAFRTFLNRLLPARRRDTGYALRAVDLAERTTTITSAPDDHQSVVAPLTARIETLEAELGKLEATAAVHRADFERERERCERLMAEAFKTTAELMSAREAAARIAGELAAFRALPWWRRLVG
jgi:septal ring factor EnvC (AmiA/AmiB activator)